MPPAVRRRRFRIDAVHLRFWIPPFRIADAERGLLRPWRPRWKHASP